jgi:hypothetical protein
MNAVIRLRLASSHSVLDAREPLGAPAALRVAPVEDLVPAGVNVASSEIRCG